MTAAWAEVTGMQMIEAADFPNELILSDRLPVDFLVNANVLPVRVEGRGVMLALSDPLDAFSPAAVAAKTGLGVQTVLARPGELAAALSKLRGTTEVITEAQSADPEDAFAGDADRLRDLASDAPIIRIVNDIIDRAIEMKASDIHITATESGTRVRVRIDGILRELDPPPPSTHPAIISRLKIIGGLDIAERRLPQDGRIRMTWRGRSIDLRLATMPHLHGEGATLRILDRSVVNPDLDQLGFEPSLTRSLRRALNEPHKGRKIAPLPTRVSNR